jgi:hypothetical protein
VSKQRYDSERYNRPHRTMRRRLDPVVQTGTVAPVRYDELIEPNTAWHLESRRSRLARRRRTRSAIRAPVGEMVASANASRIGTGHRIDLERPYRLSQRSSEDPPPGTTVNISGSPGVRRALHRGWGWESVNRRSVGE